MAGTTWPGCGRSATWTLCTRLSGFRWPPADTPASGAGCTSGHGRCPWVVEGRVARW